MTRNVKRFCLGISLGVSIIGSAAHAQMGAAGPSIGPANPRLIGSGLAPGAVVTFPAGSLDATPVGTAADFPFGIAGDPRFSTAPVVLTDPVVRQAQVNSLPLGRLTGVDLRRGVGMASVPGGGTRMVRTTGSIIPTAAGPAIRAVDTVTGVEMVALLPAESVPVRNPGQLAAARVVRVMRNGVMVRRTGQSARTTEILPADQVLVAVTGGFVPAASVRRLRSGEEVLIRAAGGPRGKITVTRSKPRANSARRAIAGR